MADDDDKVLGINTHGAILGANGVAMLLYTLISMFGPEWMTLAFYATYTFFTALLAHSFFFNKKCNPTLQSIAGRLGRILTNIFVSPVALVVHVCYAMAPLYPYLLTGMTIIGNCLAYFVSGLAYCASCLVSAVNYCTEKFNSCKVSITSFIPPNVTICLDYIYSSIIPGAVITYFFGNAITFFGNDMVDFLLTMLVGNMLSFVIVQVEQLVGGCKSKTRCSGYKSSWIIVSILLLAMVVAVSAVTNIESYYAGLRDRMQCYPQKIACFLILCNINRARNFPRLPASVTIEFVWRQVNWGAGLMWKWCVDIVGFNILADYLAYPLLDDRSRVGSLLVRFLSSGHQLHKSTSWFLETCSATLNRMQADPSSLVSFICKDLNPSHRPVQDPPTIESYQATSSGWLHEYKTYWRSQEGLFLNGEKCSQHTIRKYVVGANVTLADITNGLKADFNSSNGETQTNEEKKMKKAFNGVGPGQMALIEYKRLPQP